jgi:Ca2+-binding EF-hand superfamily protein
VQGQRSDVDGVEAFDEDAIASSESGQAEESVLTVEHLHKLHGHMDGDGDGQLSLPEALTYANAVGKAIEDVEVDEILTEVDTSKDGYVSLGEFVADLKKQYADEEEAQLQQREEKETARFFAADLNNDRMLQPHELKGLYFPDLHDGSPSLSLQEAFGDMDEDGDGRLSPDEFWGLEKGRQVMSDDEQATFTKLDADMDTYLSIDEFRVWEMGHFSRDEAMEQLFALADKDDDGHLTKHEVAEAREEIGDSDSQYHLLQFSRHHEL